MNGAFKGSRRHPVPRYTGWMRPTFALLPLLLVTASCSTNARPIFATAFFQMTAYPGQGCGDCDRVREIRDAYNGVDGRRVTCSALDQGDSYAISFNISQGDDYGLRVNQAVIPKTGGSARPGACQVSVTEDNTYSGACSANTPTDDFPCQLHMVQFFTDATVGSPVMQGRIRCEGMRQNANAGTRRNLQGLVLRPDIDDGAANGALFQIFDCPGITVTAP